MYCPSSVSNDIDFVNYFSVDLLESNGVVAPNESQIKSLENEIIKAIYEGLDKVKGRKQINEQS